MLKRTFAMVLAIVMVLGLLPLNVIAESTAQNNTAYTEPLAQHDHAASGDAHICEHCVAAGKTGAEATPVWTALTGTALPTTSGHYYLTGDITVTNKDLSNADVVLCLNGYTVTASSGKRFYTMKQGAKFTVLDCTAKTVTPENAEDTGYRAGKLVCSTDYGFMFENNAANNAQLFWYDGILTGGRKTATGGLMSVQGTADVYFYGGEVRDNRTGGSPIYLSSANNIFYAEDTAFIGNASTGVGGLISGYNAPVTMKNCLVQGNAATTTGGVFNSTSALKITVEGCTFTDNSAVTAGGVFYGKGGFFKAKNCTFTGNSAKDYSVLAGTGSGVAIELDSCRLTENSCTNNSGAVFTPNSSCPLTVKGNTYIYNNTRKDGAQGNIHLQNDSNGNYPVVTVGGLTTGAKIGINVNSTRLEASKVLSKALNSSLTRAQVIEYFYSDDTAYMVDLVDDKLVLAQGHVHTPHLTACPDSGCAGHDNVLYLPWTSTDSLPTSGNYYLDTDVVLDAKTVMTTGTLNLCLNGCTVTVGTNRFELTGDAVLNITDCSAKTENDVYTAGKITGATNGVFQINGDTDGSGKVSQLNIFEGIISDNVRTKDHAGVVFMEKKAVMNLYGGEISGNTVGATSASRGGIIYLQDNTVTFNMYGGKITGNSAVKNGTYGGNGGAIFSRDRGIVNILGGEISGNTAANMGGAIWASGGTVTVKNAKITGNTATAGTSAIHGNGGGVQIILENAEITGNTAGSYGAIFIPNNSAKIIVSGTTKVSGNNGGNLHLSKDSNTQNPNHSMITLGDGGLATGAKILITMPTGRLNVQPYASAALGGKLTEDQVAEFFAMDNTDYEVILKDDRLLVQQVGSGHRHCVCGVEGCTEHTQVFCKPWTATDSLPVSGSYYLENDIEMKSGDVALTTGTLNLCLNGKTVNFKGRSRIQISGDAVVNITDCQTTPGQLTGSTGSVFYMTGDSSGKESAVNFYQGVITGNNRTNYGAAAVAYLQSGASFNLYGGEISGNTLSANSTEDKGGIIYINNAKGTFNMYGGKITGNRVSRNTNDNTIGGHGIIWNNGGSVNLLGGEITGNTAEGNGGAVYTSGGTVNLANCLISGNSAYRGGAIYAKDGAVITDNGSTISGNAAADMGGAIFANGGTVSLTNTKITGNEAKQVSAICGSGGGVKITLDGAEVTGNKTTDAFGGAVYIPNNGAKITVKGAAKIENNQGGNVYLTKDSNTQNPNHPMITVDGLTTGAKIGITMPGARMAAQPYASGVLGGALTEAQVAEYFFSDNEDLQVVLDADRLLVQNVPATHIHCVCGTEGCTEHTQIACYPWTETNSLPVSGSYYLENDVHLTKQPQLSTGTLDLCLNGHTITIKERFAISGDAVLNITDCADQAGTITGAPGCIFYMTGDNSGKLSYVNFYRGIITGNNRTGFQAAVAYIQSGATFNLYGGEISGNSYKNAAEDRGGIIYINNKTGTFNMYGGKITGNEAMVNADGKGGHGGAIFNNGGTVNLLGGEISGNKAAGNGGAIYLNGGTLNVENVTICDNIAGNQGGAIFANGGTAILKNAQITGNQASMMSAIRGGGGMKLTLDGTKITGNKALAEDTTYGAVYTPNNGSKITLQGAVVIQNNEGGNLYLVKDSNTKNPNHSMIYLGENGLAEGAKISVNMPADRMSAQPFASEVLGGALTEAQVAEYFVCDNDRYAVTLVDDRLHVAKFYLDIGHKHCACSAAVEQCDHKEINYIAWDDPNSLPTAGNYCLTVDVKTKQNVSITGESVLNLCLNGHTIEASGAQEGTWQDRIFDIKGNATLNISDCTGKGQLTGGTYGVILFENNAESKTTLNLFGGKIAGNKSISIGGAVLLQGGGTFNMYGGEISGNSMNGWIVTDAAGNPTLDADGNQQTGGTTNGGGAIGLNGAGTTFNMYGGKIFDNECLATTYLKADGTQAKIAGRGGAIYSTRGNVNIYGGEISGNRAYQGGAIYAVIYSNINIAGGIISGNTSEQHGGGLYTDNCNVTISGGQITKNVATGSGGGIQNSNSKGVLTITGGEITENVGNYGGGIMNQGRATISIEGGLIARNQANTAAGVYIATLSPAKMSGGTITENTAVDNAGGLYILRNVLEFTGGEISGNTAGREGGGVFVYGATLKLDGGKIVNNTAKNGGGISTGRLTVTGNLEEHTGINAIIDSNGKLECRPTVKVISGEISGNSATGAGGGVLLQGYATLDMAGGSIKNNSTKSSGGGVYVSNNGTVEMTGGTFSGNHADGTGGGLYMSNAKGNFAGGVFESNTTKKQGAGICASHSEVKLSGVAIRNHNHKGVGAGYTGFNSTTTMTGGSITGNYASSYGAACYLQRGTFYMYGGSISYNNTKGNGAGIYVAGVKLYVYGGNFVGNKCEGTGGACVFTARWNYTENGVKKEDKPYVEVHGGYFAENYGRNGGAMLIQSGATLKITGGTFTKNEGPSAGGAFYISNNIQFEITGGIFTENKTDSDGGAINFNGAQGVLDGASGKLVLENNYAKRYGGAINITGEKANVTVKNVTVQNNSVSNRGGGIAVNTKAHANLENVEICNNHSAIQGGGFYVGHAPVVFLKDCNIHHNTSEAAGAGVATECVNEVTMENTIISENETKTKAGGLYTRAAKMHLINCQVINNVAGGDGGGIATSTQFSRGGEIGSGGAQPGLILENTVVSGNTCAGAGGGLHENNGHQVTIWNSQIVNNTAGTEGSGIWTRENLKAVNLTVTGNKSVNDGYAVFLAESVYDGQSFVQAVYELGGDVVIKDNQGGDMYMGPVNAVAVTAEGLTEGTDFYITLDSGLLTRRLLGVYDYEKTEDIYHVTSGNLSMTQPEVAPKQETEETQPTVEATEAVILQQAEEESSGLYVGIGVIAGVLVLAAAVLVIVKKKKTPTKKD